MSVTIRGTDNSASTPAVTGTDGDTGMFFPAADTIAFAEGGAESMRLTSAGNVGIGTSSPTAKLTVSGTAGNNNGIMSFDASDFIRIYADASFGPAINWSSGDMLRFATSDSSFTGFTEQARITSAGLLQFNSGYGSAATAYGCRAWVNFNGQGTISIRASGNVSSISDAGTGNYTINFTTAMPDANYSVGGLCMNNVGFDYSGDLNLADNTLTTGSFRVFTSLTSNILFDPTVVAISVFR